MTRTPLRPLARILSARAKGENPDKIERENLRLRHEATRDKSRARAEGRLLFLGIAFFAAFSLIGTRMGMLAASEPVEAQVRASGAPILAFNTRAPKQVRDMAEHEGVEIRYYSIIYNLLDDIKDILSGMLEPERRENFLGYAQILQVFNITKVGKIAGCKITEGNIKRGCGVRLVRDDVVIHEGTLSTLKRFKEEVSEVLAGQECGMAFTNYQDLREGDQIECFDVQIIKRSL